MTSPLATWMETLRSTWEATTPTSDGSSISYRVVDDFVEERGNGQHRQIFFGVPESGEPIAETPIQLEWKIDVYLILQRRDRTHFAFRQAIAHGISDLVKAWSNVTNWGSSSILEAILDTPTTEFPENGELEHLSGGIRGSGQTARIRFPFRVLCIENA